MVLKYIGDVLLVMGGACVGVFIMCLLFVSREAENKDKLYGGRF